jgi:hypothetical protein
MIMSTVLAMGHEPPQGPAIVRTALGTLWQVWAAYTLKRAIADVASTSDQDYRDFGLDKAEILGGLRNLREQVVANRDTPAAIQGPAAAVGMTLRLRTVPVASRGGLL